MAQIDDLINAINKIRNEADAEGNTAERVGSSLIALLNYLQTRKTDVDDFIQEQNTRQDIDGVLQGAINAEKEARFSADEVLRLNIGEVSLIAQQALGKANTSTKLVGSLHFMASNDTYMNSIPTASLFLCMTCANNESKKTFYWNGTDWASLPAAWAKLNKIVQSIPDRETLTAVENMTCGVLADKKVYKYISGTWTATDQPKDEVGDMYFVGSFYGTWNGKIISGNATATLSNAETGWMWAVSESTPIIEAKDEATARANSVANPTTLFIYPDI